MSIKINLKSAYDAYKAKNAAEKNVSLAESWKDRFPKDYERYLENLKIASYTYQQSIGKIETALDEVQKRCTARTITADTIMEWLSDIEHDLDIPKTHMKGVTASVMDGAQKFPSSYKYTPEGTRFEVEHNGKNWILTNIERDMCDHSKKVFISLPDEAKEALISRHTSW